MPPARRVANLVLVEVWHTGYDEPALPHNDVDDARTLLVFGGGVRYLQAQEWHVRTCGQGMKIVKCGELSTMWDYRKKQKQKIELLKSLTKQAAREGTYECMLQEESSAGRAGRLESKIAHERGPGVHAHVGASIHACMQMLVHVCVCLSVCVMQP